MKKTKRILLYTIKKFNDNSEYFIQKISKMLDSIAFINCDEIPDSIISKGLNIQNYTSYEEAINNNKNYDEYIIANDMFFGPFCDLEALFCKMDSFSAWTIDEIFYKNKSFVVFKQSNDDEPIKFAYENTMDVDKNIIEKDLPFFHKAYLQGIKHDFFNLKIKNIFDYIKNVTPYDENIIINDLFKTGNYKIINNALCINYVIPTDYKEDSLYDSKKIALIMYIHPENLIDYCYEYTLNVHQNTDIYIVTTSDSTLTKIKNKFDKLKNNIEYRVQQNRGRDNTALLVTCKDLFSKYDYIGFLHAKESRQNLITGDEFRNHCFNSLLYNKNYVNNLLNKFERDKKLGIILPYPPEFEPYRTIGNEWLNNYENAKRFLKQRLNYDITPDKNDIICAFGNMFWFRPNALKTLLSLNLTFEDFPEEPISANDGLLTHSIERIIPSLALLDNYYTSFVISDVKAPMYINSIMSSLKKIKNINKT